MTQSAATVLNLDSNAIVDKEIVSEDIEIPQQLINDYKTLNEKVEKTLQRISKRKQTALKK